MKPADITFITISAINILAAVFISGTLYMDKSTRMTTNLHMEISTTTPDHLEFIDPTTAYYVLQQLDVYEPVPDHFFGDSKPNFNVPKMGLRNDDDYCDKHRVYFVESPDFLFTEKNIISNYRESTLVRQVIRKYGNDIMPYIQEPMTPNTTAKYELRLDANVFFLLGGMHLSKKLGQHFGCLSQSYNQILGRSTLNRKDQLASAVVEYSKQYKTRPQCFNFDKFFPETWVMSSKEQCEGFFARFNSEEYKKLKEERTIVYIRKVGAGSHQAKGVEPVKDSEEAHLRMVYGNGTLCGSMKLNYIIQSYIYNPLLLNGHKFDFRVYMMIASTNPLIAYYHDGFLRVSLHPYDPNSSDKSVLLTNTALSENIFNIARTEGNYQGLNETELRNFQMWNFDRLQKYLLENNYITDNNWLDNYLRPEFKKAMIHLIRMASGPFIKISQVYELYGTDFMLDDNLDLWFIECNSGPVLSGSSEEKEKFITKMLSDQFDIVLGLLRSRMKRVITYVNTLIVEEEINTNSSGRVEIKDLAAKQAEFKEIIKNRFEPEFEPNPESGFIKIIDENLSGEMKYLGFIQEECY